MGSLSLALIFFRDKANFGSCYRFAGKFDVGKLPAGEQWLKVSFVGFRPLEQKVVLEGHTAVGDISLKALILDEVVVSARPPLTVQKGDTLQFNAAAVHLAEDADLENC